MIPHGYERDAADIAREQALALERSPRALALMAEIREALLETTDEQKRRDLMVIENAVGIVIDFQKDLSEEGAAKYAARLARIVRQ